MYAHVEYNIISIFLVFSSVVIFDKKNCVNQDKVYK